MVKTHPILFNTEMVRAILEDRKSQTRRRIPFWWSGEELAPYQPGDILWVRETFAVPYPINFPLNQLVEGLPEQWMNDGMVWYRADGEYKPKENPTIGEKFNSRGPWRPSIHMPKWACRLFLRVTGVRVERLQTISEEDAIAEGVIPLGFYDDAKDRYPVYKDYGANVFDSEEGFTRTARESFETLWDSLAKPGTDWASNPWVWVYCFERCEKPEGWPEVRNV